MPRTTINLETPVLTELKRLQKLEHKPLGQLISELVVQGLTVRARSQPRPWRWIRKNMGGPSVDLDDKDSLYSLLDLKGP